MMKYPRLSALRKRSRNEDGVASLEMLLVLILWLVVVFIFLNMIFMLGSLMLTQASVNRSAQQLAAVGCIPDDLQQNISDRGAIGIKDVTVRAIAPRTTLGRPITVWDRSRYLNADGSLMSSPSNAVNILTCATSGPTTIPSGNFIFVQLEYKQKLPMLEIMSGEMGLPEEILIHRSALVVSQSLSGEG